MLLRDVGRHPFSTLHPSCSLSVRSRSDLMGSSVQATGEISIQPSTQFLTIYLRCTAACSALLPSTEIAYHLDHSVLRVRVQNEMMDRSPLENRPEARRNVDLNGRNRGVGQDAAVGFDSRREVDQPDCRRQKRHQRRSDWRGNANVSACSSRRMSSWMDTDEELHERRERWFPQILPGRVAPLRLAKRRALERLTLRESRNLQALAGF